MLDEQQFAQIGSALGDVTNQRATTDDSTTGSFSYAPDQLRDLVNEWKDLAYNYAESYENAVPLKQVDGPGNEYVSYSLARAANGSGGAYLTSLAEKYEYCLDQAQKLQDALDNYLGAEHHNIAIIRNAGPQDGI